MGNLEIINEEVRKHRGELVIDGFDIVRLTGFQVGDDDYYYEMYSRKRGKYYTSCVGTFIPLSGYIKETAYRCLEKTFILNSPGSLRLESQKCPKCGEAKIMYSPTQHISVCSILGCDHIEYSCNIVGVAGQSSPHDLPKPYGV